MRLTDRDRAILAVVARHRFLTTSLILSLVPGSRQNIVRRLQRLYHAGFLDRPRAQLPLRYAGELFELVYSPTRNTLSHVIAESGETGSWGELKTVSSLFLAHSLDVSDALIRIEADCRSRGLAFLTQEDILAAQPAITARRIAWRVTIRAGADAENIGVIPDAAFAIERPDQSAGPRRLYFFLEADRGTMPIHRKTLRLSSIRRKVLAYVQSRKVRVLKDRFGIPGFQVVFIVRSQDRKKRIAEACNATSDRRSTFLIETLDALRSGETIARLSQC